MDRTGLVFFVLTALFSLAVFAGGICLGFRSGKQVKWITGVALGLILLKLVLHVKPAWEANLLPWTPYVYFQSYWLYPLGLFFFGLAVSQLTIRWNQYVVATVALGFFVYSLHAESWMIFPTDDSSMQVAKADHHCRQTTMHTCVPASCVTLLSYWGVVATEGEMARLCRTRGDGTTTFNAFRGLKLKLQDETLRIRIMEMDVSRFMDLGSPVLFCDQRGHATVMMFDGREVVVWDPLGREVRRSRMGDVGRLIYGAGVLLEKVESR